MSISYTFKKKRIYVTNEIEGYPDAIAKVDWEFTFTDGTNVSVGTGETFMDLTNLDPFTLTPEVTDAKLEEWIIEQQFANNWTEYYDFHVGNVERQAKQDSLILYYEEPSDPEDCEDCTV